MDAAVKTEVLAPDVRNSEGRWVAGRSGNPGGVPKRVREFQAVLDEHGDEERTRALFDRLRQLAMGELKVTRHAMTMAGPVAYEATLPPDPAFAKLYMERVYGPVKDKDDGLEAVLAEMPDEVLIRIRTRRAA